MNTGIDCLIKIKRMEEDASERLRSVVGEWRKGLLSVWFLKSIRFVSCVWVNQNKSDKTATN
jgi:hypothetical protein